MHFTIPRNLKRDWDKKFKARGHATLAAGIRAAVFNYLYLQERGADELDEILKTMKLYTDQLENVHLKLNEKKDLAEHSLEKTSDAFLDAKDYEQLKAEILEKIRMYQPIAITFLETLTGIPGEELLPILKRMKNEGEIALTEKYEWRLKE